MTATNHTEHYGLSQYTDDDHPTYTGDYNGDMSKIDSAIYAASQTGGGITAVEHTADLTGDGTTASPLGVATGSALNQGAFVLEPGVLSLNDFKTPGIYGIRCDNVDGESVNLPRKGNVWARGMLIVGNSGFANTTQAYLQVLIDKGDSTGREFNISMRGFSVNGWSSWRALAFADSSQSNPDISALTSRIAALETTVGQLTSAVTPSTTGLTAEMLDAQYSDDYNIIRTKISKE